MKKLLLAIVLLISAMTTSAQTSKVVYHITTGIETAAAALNNVKNHLAADPGVKIVVVTNGPGVDFLLADSKDSKGREFSGIVSGLAGQNVEFRVCNNTLLSRNIDPANLLLETKIVPSGVAEAAKLQSKEGFAYLKP
ncbi:DsrE family protein [Rhodoferax sp.]|uniref:DsrE family protein n=1 Tax=Rhodoferax sp. TaxID=50421 RepID=UPI00262C9308|nr:DsrE family protein [Rhodoferax sp.]MDD2924832.1 DsrE family protein [Rhodoferax sp.]